MSASISEMFFAARGPSRKGMVTVLFGFLDASNTHDGAKVWSLCGFLGDEGAFQKLDADWNAVLDKPCWPKRPRRFRTVECVHGYGEFDGWPFAERLTIWGEMVSVITSIPLLALGSVVVTEDFQKLNANERSLLGSENLGDSFDILLQYVFQKSIRLTRQTSEDESIALIFDDENPQRNERAYAFRNIYQKRFKLEQWFAGIGFFSSLKFTPIQAADLLAYGTYRYTMQRYPEIREPDFPILPGFARLIEGVVTAGGAFDLESMKCLAARIKDIHEGTAPNVRSAVEFLAPEASSPGSS